MKSGHRLYLQHLTYSYIFIHNHRPFVHFVSAEDYPKARSSLETKREASQRAEGITEDHEGTCSCTL